jgi:hypothetical protein
VAKLMNIWAMIQNGIILNTVYASSTDIKDPNYTWVDITNYLTAYGYMPGINWTTTDNINFTSPGYSNAGS